MSDSMIERVAEAMGEADKWDKVDNSPDYRSHLPAWQEYADMARAAIEAMREPDEDIVDAMNDIAIDGPGYVSFYPSLADCKTLFNAGISAALADPIEQAEER